MQLSTQDCGHSGEIASFKMPLTGPLSSSCTALGSWLHFVWQFWHLCWAKTLGSTNSSPKNLAVSLNCSYGCLSASSHTVGVSAAAIAVCLLQGLYSASAGTHPGGSVAGCAGHNSAACVVKDMGLKPWWPTAQP
jgi:hypothetical protein